MNRKIFGVIVGLCLIPSLAFAQQSTIESLQQQIAALLAQLANLQTQLLERGVDTTSTYNTSGTFGVNWSDGVAYSNGSYHEFTFDFGDYNPSTFKTILRCEKDKIKAIRKVYGNGCGSVIWQAYDSYTGKTVKQSVQFTNLTNESQEAVMEFILLDSSGDVIAEDSDSLKVASADASDTPSIKPYLGSNVSGGVIDNGDRVTIYWDSVGIPESHPIDIYVSGPKKMIVVSNTRNDGSYTWTIPRTLPHGEYFFFAGSYDKQPLAEGSTGTFNVGEQTDSGDYNPTNSSAFIDIEYPRIGDTHIPGERLRIEWDSEEVPRNNDIDIYLLNPNGASSVIVNNTSNDGVYSWTIPSNLSEGGYSILIGSYDQDPLVEARSGQFSIVQEVNHDDITFSLESDSNEIGDSLSVVNFYLKGSPDNEFFTGWNYDLLCSDGVIALDKNDTNPNVNQCETRFSVPNWSNTENTFLFLQLEVENTSSSRGYVRVEMDGFGVNPSTEIETVYVSGVENSDDDDDSTAPKTSGDVNGDGKVTSYDAALISSGNYSSEFKDYADVNQDGRVTDLDARMVLAYSVNIISSLPDSSFQYGDVNFDGNVTSYDAALSSGDLSAKAEIVADVNDDGSIDQTDANMILDYSVGLRNSFGALQVENNSQFASVLSALGNSLNNLRDIISRK